MCMFRRQYISHASRAVYDKPRGFSRNPITSPVHHEYGVVVIQNITV